MGSASPVGLQRGRHANGIDGDGDGDANRRGGTAEATGSLGVVEVSRMSDLVPLLFPLRCTMRHFQSPDSDMFLLCGVLQAPKVTVNGHGKTESGRLTLRFAAMR